MQKTARIKLIKDEKLKASAKQVLEDMEKRRDDFIKSKKISIKSIIISDTEEKIQAFKTKHMKQIKETEEIRRAWK